jgi:hypothetical protein
MILEQVAAEEAADLRRRTGYSKHSREDRYRYLVSKARTLSNAGMPKDRLKSELLSQYVEDYGDIRDDDPNGWPLLALKGKIQSIINNPDLKRGNPPPIRPRMSTGSVIKRPPESNWERRVKMAKDFPETMTSAEVYDQLGLDSKNARDKKVASRVMKAVGFVARRGRRWAVWEKACKLHIEPAGMEGTSCPSSSALTTTSYC